MTNFSMTPSVLAIDRFSTKEDLLSALAASCSPSRILGADVDDPRDFFCVQLLFPMMGEVNLAILSVGMGTKPIWSVKNSRIFIGFNDRVAAIWWTKELEVRQVDLVTLFSGFVEVPSLSHVVVLGEAAIIAISTDAEVMWRRDTDLITNFRLHGTRLYLAFSDEPSFMIELDSREKGQ